jgi:pyruvate/2-oxoglutarate dehydrogenase complex dihydrolipoamide dehydrogenase (E3) component
VNAGAGFERSQGDDRLTPVTQPRRVVVIGGGPAGLEAARVAAKRGHSVILAEAMPHLGGTLNLAARAPTRQQFGDIVLWLSNEVYEEGVDVRLSTYVTEGDLTELNADEYIVATGAEPRLDGVQMSHPGEPIAGIELDHVTSSNKLFEATAVEGTHALVIDDVGHYEGLAAAEHLVNQGLNVTMVTRLPTLAPGVRTALMTDPALERLANKPFTYHVGTRVLKTDGQSASLQAVTGGEIWSVNADKVVFISLNRPRDELVNVLIARGLPHRLVGDANSPRFLVRAVAEGNAAGRSV